MTQVLYPLSEVAAARWIKESGSRVDQINPALMQNYFKSQGILLKKINNTTYEALLATSKTLLENITRGEDIATSIEAMKADMRGIFNQSEARRRTIARTETLRTVNATRFEQMKAAGMDYKEWSAIGDGDTRDSHLDLDAQRVPMGKPFITPVTGREIMYPLDPSCQYPEETINCRCTILALSSLED